MAIPKQLLRQLALLRRHLPMRVRRILRRIPFSTLGTAFGVASILPTIIRQIAQGAAQISGAQNISAGLHTLATNRQFGHLLGGAGRAAGGLGQALGLAAGAAVGGVPGALVGSGIGLVFGKLSEAVGNSIEKLRDWSENLRQANFQFAEFSPAMARVAAETERRAVILSRERGQRLAPTARMLSQELDEFRRNAAYIEDLVGRIQNAGATVGLSAGNWLFGKFAPLFLSNIAILEHILQAIEKNNAQALSLSAEDYFKQFGVPVPMEFQRPARFRQPPQP